MGEDVALPHLRAVPAVAPELVLALLGAQLVALEGSSGVPPAVGVALCRTSQPQVEMLPRAHAAVTA